MNPKGIVRENAYVRTFGLITRSNSFKESPPLLVLCVVFLHGKPCSHLHLCLREFVRLQLLCLSAVKRRAKMPRKRRTWPLARSLALIGTRSKFQREKLTDLSLSLRFESHSLRKSLPMKVKERSALQSVSATMKRKTQRRARPRRSISQRYSLSLSSPEPPAPPPNLSTNLLYPLRSNWPSVG